MVRLERVLADIVEADRKGISLDDMLANVDTHAAQLGDQFESYCLGNNALPIDLIVQQATYVREYRELLRMHMNNQRSNVVALDMHRKSV